LFGGVIKGTAQLNFSGPWTLSGKLEAKVLELTDAAPAIFSSGRVNGEGAFSMSSANAKDLFSAPALQGKFTVTPSTLKLVDLPQSLENRGDIAVGSTSVDSTGGDIQLSGTQIRLKNILITAGQITGLGNFELDTSRRALGGRLAVEAPGVDGPRRSGFAISGTVDRPLLKRTN
jgi:hypothetical protein